MKLAKRNFALYSSRTNLVELRLKMSACVEGGEVKGVWIRTITRIQHICSIEFRELGDTLTYLNSNFKEKTIVNTVNNSIIKNVLENKIGKESYKLY